jgi:hypothetical protein
MRSVSAASTHATIYNSTYVQFTRPFIPSDERWPFSSKSSKVGHGRTIFCSAKSEVTAQRLRAVNCNGIKRERPDMRETE